MSSGIYLYDPLSSTSALRIIRLPPAPDDKEAAIMIQLFESSFEDAPSYEAVSYTWDQQSFTEPILCNGKDLFVTPNVLTILHDFRNEDEDRLLWIDSICIDQSSSYDKSIQVPRMDRVYSQAQMVLVWLGRGSKETDAVFDCYSEMSLGTHIGSNIWKNERGFWEPTNENELGANEEFGMGFIGSLFRRSWFTRAWTTQELVLAKKATFICGSKSIGYEDFISVSRKFIYSVLHGIIDKHYDMEVRYTRLKALIKYRHDDDKSPWEQAPFAAVLEEARQKNAFNPRDKIYSVYGILSALEIVDLPPVDYSKELADVYIEATRAAIQIDNSLEILLEACVSQLIPGLPSWVPDWSNTAAHGNEQGGWPEATGESEPVYRFDGPRLHLLGTIIDEIATTVPPIPDYGNIENVRDSIDRRRKAKAFISMLRQWITLVRQKLSSYPTGDDLDDVFSWTLTQTNEEIADTPSKRQHKELGPSVIEQWISIIMSIQPERDIWPQTNYILSDFEAKDDSGYFQRAFSRMFSCGSNFKDWDNELKVLFTLKTSSRDVQSFQNILVNSIRHKTVFIVQDEFLGLAPCEVQAGDKIALVSGLRVPLALRQDGRDYRLFGPVFIHGFMKGERWPDNQAGLENIVLV